MGMSEFYGTGDERERRSPPSTAPSTSASPSSTPPTCTAPSPTSSWSARPSPAAATRSQLATKFGNERRPDGSRVGINGRPEYVRAGLRRLAAAARRRPHRPLLPAPRRPDRPDRGDRRRHGRAGRGRQGPPPRPLRGRPPQTIRRAHAVHPITALQTRVLAVHPRPRGRDPARRCRELGIGLVPYSPLGRGLLTGADHRADVARGERLAPARRTSRASRARPSTPTSRWSRKVREIADAKGCTPGQLALAWVLAQGDGRRCPIPGTKRVAYLEENVGAAGVELTDDDLAALEDAVPRDAVAGDRYGDMSLHRRLSGRTFVVPAQCCEVSRRLLRRPPQPPVVEEGALAPVSKPPQPTLGRNRLDGPELGVAGDGRRTDPGSARGRRTRSGRCPREPARRGRDPGDRGGARAPPRPRNRPDGAEVDNTGENMPDFVTEDQGRT